MPTRIATTADVDAMHQVRVAVTENQLSDPSRISPDQYRTMLEDEGRGWVHEEDGRVVAFGIADRRRSSIWALFIAPGFEARGIGRELLAIMVRWLFEQGAATVWLTTGRATRAEQFYRKAGWTAVGTEPDGEMRFELRSPA